MEIGSFQMVCIRWSSMGNVLVSDWCPQTIRKDTGTGQDTRKVRGGKIHL